MKNHQQKLQNNKQLILETREGPQTSEQINSRAGGTKSLLLKAMPVVSKVRRKHNQKS
jgi:hypothetical protein